MDCFIKCFNYICKEKKIERKDIEKDLYLKVNEKGLSLYDIKEVMIKYEIDVKMVRTLKIPDISFIAYYDYGNRGGHFVYVKSKSFFRIKVYDPCIGLKKMWKFYFYMKWSKIAVFIEV